MNDDIYHEKLLTLPQAAATLPRKRGKRVHASTIYRWIRHGVRGIRLESCLVGTTRCTSLPAVRRFSQKLSRVKEGERSANNVATPRSLRRAERDNARAKKALQDMKVLPSPTSEPKRPILHDDSAPPSQIESRQRS
jgi:hypothetical protein